MPKQFAVFGNDKARITTALPPAGVTDAFTVMAWVKWNSSSAVFRPAIYRFNNTLGPFIFLGLNSSGVYHFNWNYTTSGPNVTVDGATLNVGTWYHCAFTMSSRTGVSYLNAVLVGSGTDSNSSPATTNDMLLFGGDDDTDAEVGLNSICAIKVFDYALLPSEILAEMAVAYPVNVQHCTHWASLRSGQNPYLDFGPGGVFDTFAGTLTDWDEPPVSWSPRIVPQRRRRFAASSAAAQDTPELYSKADRQYEQLLAQ